MSLSLRIAVWAAVILFFSLVIYVHMEAEALTGGLTSTAGVRG